MQKIEILLDTKDRFTRGFQKMGSSIKNLKRTVLGTQREFQAYGNQMQKLNQVQLSGSQKLSDYNRLMGNYQKNLTRLATQIPKNVNQQNSWSASVTRTSNALRPYVKNFDQLAPTYKKINQQAFQAGTQQRLYNQSMSQGTGITQRAGKATTSLKQKFGGLLDNLRKGHGAWYDWGRVFNHFLPIVFVGVYAFKALTDKIDTLVKSFAEFESQLITVERTTGMAHSQVMNLRETIFELARVTPVATSGLMEVAITAGRLGIRGSANIMGFTDTVTKMASATVLTADQAANALARISKAMELPIENVENLGAMIDELANTAAADAEQITTALKRAAGGAKVLDVPVAMLGAMVTTLVESGEEAARTGCVDLDTEILTKEGWKNFYTISENDEIATVSPEEYMEFKKPTMIYRRSWNGKMIHFKKRTADIRVSPDHRMVVWRRHLKGREWIKETIEAKELLNQQDFIIPATCNWKGNEIKETILPSTHYNNSQWDKIFEERTIDMRLWSQFMGYFLSEGYIDKSSPDSGRIVLCQSDGEIKESMRKCLIDMGFEPRDKSKYEIAVGNKQLYKKLEEYVGKRSWTKYIPQEIKDLSPKYLEIFLHAFCEGDGSFRDNKMRSFYSSSSQLIGDLEEVALKCNYRVSHSQHAKVGTRIETNSKKYFIKHPEYTITVTKKKGQNHYFQKGQVSEEDYDGMIYCPVLPPYETIYTRRNGKIAWMKQTRLGRIFTYASVKIATMARQMGISTQEMRRQMETNVTQVFLDYLKMLDNTTSKVEKLRMAHEVFGMIGVKSISKLAENYDLLIGHLKDAQAQIIFGTTLEREYARTLGTTAAQMQMLTNQIDELSIRMGEKLTPITLAFMGIHKSLLGVLVGPEFPQFTSTVIGLSEAFEQAMGIEMEEMRISEKRGGVYAEQIGTYRKVKALKESINQLNEKGGISEKKYAEITEGFNKIQEQQVMHNILGWHSLEDMIRGLQEGKKSESEYAKEVLKTTDAVSQGAVSQLLLNSTLDKGWNSLIMIARQNKRVEKGRISLVRTMIKEGVAGKKLEETYEGLVDSILEQKRIVKELQEAYINFNQIGEWTTTLLGEETDAFYKAAVAQGKALEGWSNMNEKYEETIDLMDTLKGDIPELINILDQEPTGLMKSITDAIAKDIPDAFGDFVKIGNTIVPIKKTIESIRKEAEELGRVKGVGDPLNMEKMIELYDEWQKETDEYKKSIREQTIGEGELKLKKQELLNTEVEFIKYITSHFSDYDEAINYLDELGLANTELGKAVIDTMKRTGSMLPEAMSKPVEEALKLYIDWQEASKEYAILSRTLTGDDIKAKEELAEVRDRLFENEKAYTSYLTSHFSDYATVIEFLHESGLASDEYGKSIINLLTLKEEELGLWKETPKAMAAAFDYFDAAIHYGTRLEAINKAQIEGKKELAKWGKTFQSEDKKGMKDAIDLMVKDNKLLRTEGEYLKGRIDLLDGVTVTLEDLNKALLHSVSYSYYAMQQGLDLDDANQKVEKGYKSLNSQIFEMASQMAKGGLITGAVADDILLLTGSQIEFGKLLDKDVDALDTFLDHLMLVGQEMGDWDKFIHAVNASLKGTGIEIFKVDAAGKRLKEGDDIKDFFLGIGKESENAVVVSEENIASIISTWQKLPQASKKVLKGIGLEYLSGAPAHITAAFTGTTEDKLSSMTLSTGSSASTLDKIYNEGIPYREGSVEGAAWGGYVKQTGIYRLHRGEIITPASKVEKSGGSPIHISFPNMIIKEELDINKIRTKIANVIETELSHRLGR